MKRICGLFLALLLLSCGGGGGGGETILAGPIVFTLEQVAASVPFPVGLTAAPDGRLFFTELKSGRIRVIKNGQIMPVAFATLEVPAIADFNTGMLRRYSFRAADGAVLGAEILFGGGVGGILEVVAGADGFIYFTATDAIYRLVPAA